MKKFCNLSMPRLFQIIFVFVFISISSFRTDAQTITENTVKMHDGYLYFFWKEDNLGSVSMTLGPDGNYKTEWTNISNFISGKGWLEGRTDRTICYDGTFDGGSNGYLALYGWTKKDVIEYYVVENHGAWIPFSNISDAEYKGSFICDGGTYKIYRRYKLNFGINPIVQYWSIRTETRSSGTITFSKHVEEWEKYGMYLGVTMDYQLMITEGYQSSGNSNITICGSETSPVSVALTASATPLTAPAYINMTATASTTSGSIEKVEFYNGTTKLGEDLSAPYTYTWVDVALGSYYLKAVAFNNLGETTKSAIVRVTVLNTPSKVLLNKGWNIIGCPLAGSTPVEIALHGIWDRVESIKDKNAYYINTNPPFLNTLLELNYGKGYLIKVSDSCELIW